MRGEPIELAVNGKPVVVQPGTTVAAAILMNGAGTRTSVSGEMRAPLCGMGICFECRAWIDGEAHRKSCQILCRPGMDVRSS
ncbi:MAG TPA: (2Fe-2S)-binding protein [Acidobacteriaceae bacterium]|jgi:sarcosine oxidase subunit alpha|nr:(2Fe-2S)-binding protein [Acidobacteriaceae bacterium]